MFPICPLSTGAGTVLRLFGGVVLLFILGSNFGGVGPGGVFGGEKEGGGVGPSYFFISLVIGPLNSIVWYVPSSRCTRGLGWRIHCSVEVTESSTNKQHHHHLSPFLCPVCWERAVHVAFLWRVFYMEDCLVCLSSLSLCFRFDELDQFLFATRWSRWSRHLIEAHNPSFIFIVLRDI
jgi:hypothetical protein